HFSAGAGRRDYQPARILQRRQERRQAGGNANAPGVLMRNFARIALLAAVGLAAIALVYSGSPPRPAPTGTAPYYKRTGFLSQLLLDLDTSPRGLKSIHVPEGFEVTPAAKPGLVTYPMFFTFDDRGRLFVCESAGRNIGDQEMMDRQPEMRISMLED